jgi:DamX protein
MLKRYVFLVAMGLLLSGCAHRLDSAQANKHDITVPASACNSNPYLQKFGCSADVIQQSAERGDADAQYALGYMYYYGIGTVVDIKTARLWIAKSASQGQPLAKKALAMLDHPNPMTTQQATAYPAKAHRPIYATSQLHDARLSPGALPITADNQLAPAKIVARANTQAAHFADNPEIKTQEAALLSTKTTGYTIQLMGSHSLLALQKFIQKNHLAGKVHYYRSKFQGQPWYLLIYGDYANAGLARFAIRQLPQDMTRGHPWIKSYKVVRQEILAHQQKA